MRVPLPSGHYAELRDDLLGGDRRIAKKAIKAIVAEDGSRELQASFEEDVKYALLTRLVVGWDYTQHPLPSAAVDPVAVLDSLPLPDLNVLLDAVQPTYDLVMGNEGKDKTPASAQS